MAGRRAAFVNVHSVNQNGQQSPSNTNQAGHWPDRHTGPEKYGGSKIGLSFPFYIYMMIHRSPQSPSVYQSLPHVPATTTERKFMWVRFSSFCVYECSSFSTLHAAVCRGCKMEYHSNQHFTRTATAAQVSDWPHAQLLLTTGKETKRATPLDGHIKMACEISS